MADPFARSPLEPPETRYVTRPDGVSIAYQRFGSGPIDLVWIPHFLFNVDLMWEFEPIARWLDRLASFSRVLIHDPAGTGLSDRQVEPGEIGSRAQDLVFLLDELGIERAAIFGAISGGALGALVAATHPDRVSALIWYNAMLSGSEPEDTGDPRGASTDDRRPGSAWGSPERSRELAATEGPTGQVDPVFQRWMGRMLRSAITPARADHLRTAWEATDVRAALPSIRVPTLLLSREGFGLEGGKEAASLIAGATFRSLPGHDAMAWFGDTDAVATAIREFLRLDQGPSVGDRFLATILHSDIVGSTDQAVRRGDDIWRNVVRDHHRILRGQLDRFGGREMDTAGDGFFATFETPGAAARCGLATVEAVKVLGIEIRIGIHVGECYLADGKVAGTAVAIGARVASAAGPSEVLTTPTVRDLTAGSGLAFEDVGEHVLKGIPDPWRLYRVRSA